MYDTNRQGYPHAYHTRYVRGCVQCLERSKAGARRLTESRRRASEARRASCEHDYVLMADDSRICKRCYQRTTL